jgi:hypothetical protein
MKITELLMLKQMVYNILQSLIKILSFNSVRNHQKTIQVKKKKEVFQQKKFFTEMKFIISI